MHVHSPEAEYSIAAVSKLAGVSCHALRVWERRYGFPAPRRSPSGHRRYGCEQVRVLRRLSELARIGHPIGELIADIRSGRLKVEDGPAPDVLEDGDPTISGLVDCWLAGDMLRGSACFDRLSEHLGPAELIDSVISPALVDTGERWFRRECSVFQEHCVSGLLRRKLESMIEAARRANVRPERTILVGTVQGDRHEGGALMLNLLLEHAGWRVLNLGVDLPIREYQDAVAAWRPHALALSFVLSRNINKRFRELEEIRDVPIFVGGRSILNYQSLARRHGLVPLPGPIAPAIKQLDLEYQSWVEGHQRPAPLL